jgi:uncharacterized membrane protein
MLPLIAGLVLFLGIHSVAIFVPGARERAIRAMGAGAWKGLYALVSLAGFVLLCYGFSVARQSPLLLYSPPHWLRHVALLLMLPVFPLLFAAYLPGRIKAAVKHPMLVAVKTWALAHLLANGGLADLVLFGSFLAWAVADRISLKRRPAVAPLRSAAPRAWNDAAAVVLGLIVYAVTIGWLHLRLFGVSPLAP